MKLLSVKPDSGKHKFVAHFITDEGRNKHVRFGLKGYQHFTNGNGYVGHLDEERRRRYLSRHRGMGEHWNNPMTPGALSKWLLWTFPQWNEALDAFRHRFGL